MRYNKDDKVIYEKYDPLKGITTELNAEVIEYDEKSSSYKIKIVATSETIDGVKWEQLGLAPED